MEYFIGPTLALCLGMKFTLYTSDKRKKELASLEDKIEKLEEKLEGNDQAVAKQLITAVMPVAKAVRDLQTEVGIR